VFLDTSLAFVVVIAHYYKHEGKIIIVMKMIEVKNKTIMLLMKDKEVTK
jgi:hypothetical protein